MRARGQGRSVHCPGEGGGALALGALHRSTASLSGTAPRADAAGTRHVAARPALRACINRQSHTAFGSVWWSEMALSGRPRHQSANNPSLLWERSHSVRRLRGVSVVGRAENIKHLRDRASRTTIISSFPGSFWQFQEPGRVCGPLSYPALSPRESQSIDN